MCGHVAESGVPTCAHRTLTPIRPDDAFRLSYPAVARRYRLYKAGTPVCAYHHPPAFRRACPRCSTPLWAFLSFPSIGVLTWIDNRGFECPRQLNARTFFHGSLLSLEAEMATAPQICPKCRELLDERALKQVGMA